MQTCNHLKQGGAVFLRSSLAYCLQGQLKCQWKPDWLRDGRCGTLGSISPLCSSKIVFLGFFMHCSCSLSDCLVWKISVPLVCYYVMVCVGYEGYADSVITVLYEVYICQIGESLGASCLMMLWWDLLKWNWHWSYKHVTAECWQVSDISQPSKVEWDVTIMCMPVTWRGCMGRTRHRRCLLWVWAREGESGSWKRLLTAPRVCLFGCTRDNGSGYN